MEAVGPARAGGGAKGVGGHAAAAWPGPDAACRIQALLLVLMAWLLVALPLQATPAPPLSPVVITSAEVSHDDGATWHGTTLPDSWARRGPQDRAAALYRLSFDLASAPVQALAMRFERLSTHHRISLNGQLLLQRGDGPDFVNRRAAAPALIDLPPALLRAGRNTLLVEVQHAGKGVLSAPVVGPTDSLRRAHAFTEVRSVDIPQALNLAILGLALFMLTVWLRRPGELALGCFGAAALIMALRNLAYFTAIDLAPPGLMDWFFYSAQVSTAVLLGLFARALTGHRGRPYLWLLGGLLLVLPLVAAVCAALDHANLAERLALGNAATRMGLLRRWTYPLLLLAMLPALAWTLRLACRQPRRSMVLLAAGVGALMLAGLHDYAVQVGRIVFTTQYMLPYVFPMVMGAMSVFLVARMVAATGAAEALARELDARVALRTQQLSQANAAKARFLSAASHDLRQPAMTISLLASLLRDTVAGVPAAARLVAKLQAATQALDALLDGLLDMSRLDPALAQARTQVVALQTVFDAIARHEQALADQKQLRLRWRPTALHVQADPVLLEQLLRNLVGNALRYTRQGGVLVTARQRRGQGVCLQVWDTGVGIAAADQARVFDEFVQLGNPGRDGRLGQGLGLAIVRRAAAAMGASVSLRSVPGRGSCFSVTLPPAQPAPVVATVPVPATVADTTAHLRGLTVWVLDDHDDLRQALAWRLERWGALVEPLASLAALQHRLADTGPDGSGPGDLLISDQRLGDGSGRQALLAWRAALGPRQPALLATGDPDSPDAQALRAEGIPVLAKPWPEAELLRAILAAVAAARA